MQKKNELGYRANVKILGNEFLKTFAVGGNFASEANFFKTEGFVEQRFELCGTVRIEVSVPNRVR